MRSLGLYVHIPFCKAKCIYCDFYSLARQDAHMDEYVSALSAQLAAWSGRASGYTVDTVYFGGGTPSYLGAPRLCALLQTIFAHYHVAPDAEITLEANPDSAQDTASLRQLRRAGFNRLSLGMQSSNDEELLRIGRVHTHAETVRAVEAARASGFDNLSLDLIYGLPEQSMAQWKQNLAAAAALSPEHLSCYGLKVEEGTPLSAQASRFSLPDDELQADEYLYTVDFLAQQGYTQYEISNFCRPGRRSRHNSRYWAMAEYLGFGPGAHSDFGGRRFALARDLRAYLNGRTQYTENAVPAPGEREEERIMLALRTTDGIRTASLPPAAQRVLAACQAHGLSRCVDGRCVLTPRGFLVSNSIIVQVLDAAGL